MSESSSLPADHQQRMQALDPKRCVCVTAPAGAGKTQLLSQRVLTLLATADQPEEILAITFTRKAAAEMHHRIIQALQMGAEEKPQESHHQLTWELANKALARDEQCDWQILSNPSRLKIQTIDSLCSSLTRQMPILANFGAQPQIAENAQLYYRSAVQNLLHELEGDTFIAEDLVILLAHVDNDVTKVERLLMALLQRRDQWLLHIGIGSNTETAKELLEITLGQIIEETLSGLWRKMLPLSSSLIPLLDYAGKNLKHEDSPSIITALADVTELPSNQCSSVKQWQAIAQLLLTQSGEWRKSVNKRCGFPTQTVDGDKKIAKERKEDFSQLLAQLYEQDDVKSLFQELLYLPDTTYSIDQWTLLQSLTRLLPSLVAQLTLVFQQYGEVDYSQMAIAALQALGGGTNPTELALKLDHQLRHILVDEFQDTASTQFTLLERLVEGWHEHNTVDPERPNTLFIVGDGMQSIYGFREANVGLFLGARKQGINGLLLDDLPLTVNFRSDPAVVNWVNTTFSEAFPKRENLSRGAVPFEHAQAFKPSDTSSKIEMLGFTGEKARVNEAQKIVEIVLKSQQANPDNSIAVLVRSRSHLLEIIPALSQAGVTWNATDIDPLANLSPVIDILSLTKALLNCADRVSWTALLRTPWIGLTNRDLHAVLTLHESTLMTDEADEAKPQASVSILTAISHSKNISGLSSHARERLPKVSQVLNTALENRHRLPVRSWIEGVWMQLGGAASLIHSDEFTAIDDYLDLLEHHQQGELLTKIEEFELAVQSLYAAPTNQDSTLHVMTIHKSKGLEFDTVILPGMARPARSDDKSLLMWKEHLVAHSPQQHRHGAGVVISPLGAAGNEEDRIYQYLRYEQSQSTMLENTRLFYVAATRAVKQLYVTFEAQYDEKQDDIKPPAKNSLISCAWPVIKAQAVWENETNAAHEQFGLNFEQESAVENLSRLSAHWEPPQWSYINPLEEYYLSTQYNNSEHTDDDNRPELAVDPLARCVGTVTHRILEQLVDSGIQFWLAMDGAARGCWLDSILHHFGLPSTQWPEAMKQVIHAVDNTINDSRGQWILSSTHEQSMCEWELLACFPAGVKQKVIDRSFVDEKGVYWVVDYKTSHPHTNETKEDFIIRETQLYRNQLTEYASYLSMMEHQLGHTQTIKTALYFTYYPHWEEVSA